MNLLSVIALILIFLGGLGGILLTIGQYKSSAVDKSDIINTTKIENAKLKQDLKEIKNERDSLNKTLEKRDLSLAEQTAEIISLNRKLQDKSNYIQNYLTGGNSFPFLEVQESRNSKSDAQRSLFRIVNNFEMPIYNLQIAGFNYDQIETKSVKKSNNSRITINYDQYLKCRVINQFFNELPPHTSITLQEEIPLVEKRYFVIFSSRGQAVMEKIVTVQLGQELLYGAQLVRLKDHTVLKEDFSPLNDEKKKEKIKDRLNTIPVILYFN